MLPHMTLRANARLAGLTLLIYFVAGIGSHVLFNQTSAGYGTAARLANIAQHVALVRVGALLQLVEFLCELVLAVTLFALTRDQDRDLALLAMSCRLTEGVIAALAAGSRLDLLAVAIASRTATGPDAAAVQVLGASLLNGTAGPAALCFSVGNLIFASLFLRARSIPVWLASLGVVASILGLVEFSLEMLDLLHGPATIVAWIPMALFELILALWLLIRGVAVRSAPASSPTPAGSPTQ
jgi:hypothetical protein